jgi:hypothetical protein
MAIPEKKVVLAIKKYFEKRYGKTNIDFNKVHVSPLHNRGFPDLLVFTPEGTWVIEAKAPAKKPTKLQRAKLIKIRDTGRAHVYWVDCDKNNVHALNFRNPETDKVEFTSLED